jgi:YVTN family beta-propeller protein
MRFRATLWLAFLALGIASAVPRAQSSADRLIVLNKEDATLVIVNPSTGEVLGRVATGEGPHEVAVSEDGSTAFVGNYGAQTPGHTLSVIDLAAQKEVRRVDLAPLHRPHGIVMARGKVYFTAETNRAVARYDPAANAVDWLLGTGQAATHMVWASEDATRIITTDIGSDSVTIMERGANPLAWNQTVVPVGKGPEGFDLTPDGRELWTAHSRDGHVSVIDLATKKVVHTLDVGTTRANRLKFTPDGRLALISDLDAGELVVVDVPARTVSKRLPLGKMPEGILMAPDGSRAFVAVNGDDHVAVVDLRTLTVTSKIATGDGPDGMAWAGRGAK